LSDELDILSVLEFGGAVGTLAALGDKGLGVQEALIEHDGVIVCDSTIVASSITLVNVSCLHPHINEHEISPLI